MPRDKRAAPQPFKTSKGTIQFTPAHPLPAALVKKMMKSRLARMAAKRGAG